jgi:hypothetical protein
MWVITLVQELTPRKRVSLDSCSASQEILCLVWKPKIHYRVQKGPPVNHMLRHVVWVSVTIKWYVLGLWM